MKTLYYIEVDREDGIDVLNVENTPDGTPRLWALYKPEEKLNPSDTNIYLWIRRVDYLHISAEAAKQHLINLLEDDNITWENHSLFPELLIGTDNRNFKWYLEPIPLCVKNDLHKI